MYIAYDIKNGVEYAKLVRYNGRYIYIKRVECNVVRKVGREL
jgi:hypothetical protein